MTLKEHYNTKEDIAKLIDGGNMSCCYSDNEYDEEKQEFVKNDPKPEYYGGDDERPHNKYSTTMSLHLIKMQEKSTLYLFVKIQ